mmetsp:Transcript_67864/g.106006  ORF Transcript_67864/g.106006 Transcript_67864/m.106006 type:complete len:300 (-) Transcript_67864:13-912(-)
MSISGFYDVPKVVVGRDNDMRLKPAGKRCAAAGLPNLPGGMMRSHSMPGMALTCPIGWLADDVRRNKEMSRQHQETLRDTSRLSASLHGGSWSGLESSLRPSTVAVERIAGGGRTQGARSMRPHSVGALGAYDPEKHGWHDPRGQMEQTRLTNPAAGMSWAWNMRKARNHIGYGDDGVVNWGDIQTGAVSGDGPDWFVGTRTVPGPFNTKSVPVRRHPFVHIDGKQMRARGKTFQQGNHLDCIETLHETNKVPMKPERPAMKVMDDNKARYCSLMHGGCQTKHNPFPSSGHITSEGRRQ